MNRILCSFLLLCILFPLGGCSEDNEDPAIKAESFVAATPFDACIGHARIALALPEDTVFAWGMHRDGAIDVPDNSVARDTQVIETWFVAPQHIGAPDSRSLTCVVKSDGGGKWRTSEFKTEKRVSPGLGDQ